MRHNGLFGDLIMLFVTCIWGAAYPFSEILLQEIPAQQVLAGRFTIGFLVCFLVFAKTYKKIKVLEIKQSLILGGLLTLTFLFMNYGVMYSSGSNAGFLNSLTVVFVPIIQAVRFRKKPGRTFLAGAVLVIAGLLCLCLEQGFALHIGDIFSILCAFVYALYMVVQTEMEKTGECVILGSLPMLVVAFTGMVLSFFKGGVVLPVTPKGWIALAYLGVFCSGLAFLLQAVAQKKTTANHISLIYATLPVFVLISSVVLVNESVTGKDIIGMILAIAGVVVVEVLPEKKAAVPEKDAICNT